ncbi:MAG TPA: hypothetical protein VFA93_02700 [Patescibacteria group bacterium]|nr:hypothetical protein [Patescibacteria group bacterium]
MMWGRDGVWWGATSAGRMMPDRAFSNSPFFLIQSVIYTIFELLFLVILILIVLWLWEKVKRERR